MRAAVHDVHHRHRQEPRGRPAEITVERKLRGSSRRLGHRERHAEDRVGAEPRLILGAVERDQRLVDLGLVLGIHAADRVENFALGGGHRLLHAIAEIALLVAVAQFDRLVRARRGA